MDHELCRRGDRVAGAQRRRRRQPLEGREYTDRFFKDTLDDNDNDVGEGRYLDVFLNDNEGSRPDWNNRLIQEFCQTRNAAGEGQMPPEIGLHDHKHGSTETRTYSNNLATDELRQKLSVGRFDVDGLPDADYRQIRIRNPDGESFLALAETAAYHQVETLKDAFIKHLSLATSFKIHERIGGFGIPQLELHLPYLMLRRRSEASTEWKPAVLDAIGDVWSDILFPESFHGPEDLSDGLVIQKAHISIVLCMWDYSKWVGYAFSRSCSTGASVTSDDSQDGRPKEDVFAPEDFEHDLYDNVVQDPRRYFLRIVDVWIKLVLQEYTNLICTVEARIRAWEKKRLSAISNGRNNVPRESFAQRLETIEEMMHLLKQVQDHLSPAIQSWGAFSAADGDTRRLKDLQDSQTLTMLDHIKTSFSSLTNLEHKVHNMIDTCKQSAKTLKHRLNLEVYSLQREAHRINLDTNKTNRHVQRNIRKSTKAALVTGRLTLTNLLIMGFVTPLGLSFQYFGTERPIFSSFDRNPRNFWISILIFALGLFLLTQIPSWVACLLKCFNVRIGHKKDYNAEDDSEDSEEDTRKTTV